jgi:hypothetical protein
MAVQQPSLKPSVACITEIDIQSAARALAVLRVSDYALVIGCGFGAIAMVPDLVLTAINAQWVELAVELLMVSALAFAVYSGWRHVGVIDPSVWRSYLLVFPFMVALTGAIGLTTATTGLSQGAKFFEDAQSVLALIGSLLFAAVAIPGFVSVLLLRRTHIAPMGIRLDELLAGLTARGGQAAPRLTNVQRIDVRRGIAYGVAGAIVLLGVALAPIPTGGRQATSALRAIDQLNILGFFLIVRARRYFQVSADSLLAADKRPPILFLRSFADDERQHYVFSQRALLDFSLEARLANHFHRFGPFIAIGSPKETVPQPGAARILLSDDEWQARVLGWMKDANLIIMYCGTTQWVNWELRRVVESGRTTSLILMFPESKVWRSSRRKRDIEARVEQIRHVFRDTPWTEELMTFSDFAGLRSMIFRADGSMVMIRSRSRSRDAYHLAALIAHQQLLDGTKAPQIEKAAVDAPWPRRTKVLAAATVVAAAIGVVYLLDADSDPRVTFKQGVLLYNDSVSPGVASGVGEYLVRQNYFSDDKAVTVQLHQEEGIYRLRFVIEAAHANDLLPNIEFGVMGSEIAREVLGGQSIEVALYDHLLEPIKTVPASRKLVFGKGELYFTDPIAMDEAREVGKQLQLSGLFGDDRGASVHFGREDGTYQLRFVIDPSRAADQEVIDGFRELAGAITAQALGGQPVVVHLCDSEFRTLRRERVQSRAGRL